MTYRELLVELEEKSDKKFAEFSKALSNSDYTVIGVKNPILRELIKLHKNDTELNISDFEVGIILEVDFIYFGLGLTRIKTSKEKLDFLRKNIKFAKSWAITDTINSYFKTVSFDEFWEFFLYGYKSQFIYERRMVYVLALKLYKENKILDVLPYLQTNEDYIVMMAEAWLLATTAICYPNEIYDYLKTINDPVLIRKTISKMRESFRIDEKVKKQFIELRKNL